LSGGLQFDILDTTFNFAIAQAVFTYLSFNRIRRCLTRLAPVMESGGKFFATFFEVRPNQNPEDPIIHNPGDTITYSDRNIFHYRVEDFQYAASRSPWNVHYIGEWGHPRGQKMLLFEIGQK
jgi:hypothetical protein